MFVWECESSCGDVLRVIFDKNPPENRVSKNANSNVSEGDRRSEKRIEEENQNVLSCFK